MCKMKVMKNLVIAISLLASFAFNSYSQEEIKISKNLKIEGDWCDGWYMLIADFKKSGGTWQWAKDGVIIEDAVENSINLALLGNGKYTVMYKMPNNKVIYTEDYEFKTLPGVKANFDYDFFYAASAIRFKNTTAGITADYSWSWNFGNGTTSTEMNPIVEFKPGTYTVTLKVTDKNGCWNEYSREIVFQFGQ